MSDYTGMEVAILAMSGRFPRAVDLDRFWQNLRDGVEAISFFSAEELAAAGEAVHLPGYVPAGVILEGADLFDAQLFDILPSEAELIDPQQRILLECSQEALERAGYGGTRRSVGAFVGTSENSYLLHCLLPHPDLTATVGRFSLALANSRDYAATRLAYKLDLTGPAVTVQTACSTSLVAVHLACQSLLAGECELALVGAATVRAPLRSGYYHQNGGIASPDGCCRAFDARAQGTFPGQGAGVVVLKLLDEALRDGDTIRAVIKGSALNNDGLLKTGFTAPSRDGQAQVVRAAQLQAKVEPETIGYVEAHGTATPLGDPIEVAALTRAFSQGTRRKGFCALGSVKTNLGHLDAAAGMAGLLKTVLALEHGEIPPSLHFEVPNPEIDFTASPFFVNTQLVPWPRPAEAPRRAGVSSFGLGGTNSHVILEEAPTPEDSGPSRPHQLLLLSAASASALERATDDLASHLGARPELSLADVAFTLQVGRRMRRYRRALVTMSTTEAAEALARRHPGTIWSGEGERATRPIAFLLPGVGDQYAGMARELSATEPVFRRELERCAVILRPCLGLDVRDALCADGDAQRTPSAGGELRELLRRGGEQAPEGPLDATSIAQPAMMALGWSLAQLWISWGIKPQAVLGYSLGEYTAACLAGVLSLEEGLTLAARRAELIERLPRGAMLAVPLPEDETVARLLPGLSLAAVNATSACVVAGPLDAVVAFESGLASEGVPSRRLRTSHAFHSRAMEPVADEFRALLRSVRLNPPRLPMISNVTGSWLLPEEATDPEHWVRHLLGTVRFAAGVAEIWKEPGRVVLEMGPGQALASLALQQAGEAAQALAMASMPHSLDRRPASQVILSALGQLWLAGIEVDWEGFYQGERRRRIPLPTHPLERKRFWIEPQLPAAAPAGLSGSAVRLSDPADWFHAPSWKLSPLPSRRSAATGRWLILTDQRGLGGYLAEKLRAQGCEVQIATTSASETLTAALERPPDQIVHLWNWANEESTQEHGFNALLRLSQTLGRHGASASPAETSLVVVTDGMCRIEANDRIKPEKALLLGPVRVIPQEYAHLRCRAVDIDPAEKPDLLAERLLTELTTATEPLVAWRRGQRWVQSFEPVRLEESAATPLREGGVYLITGGLGGIGIALAAHLAETLHARLALLSRSGLPERTEWRRHVDSGGETARRIRAVEALEAAGAEVLVIQADVADEAQMRGAVEHIRRHFGVIHGVFHAAGVAGGGLIQLKTSEAAEAVLAPKVAGTRVLETVLRESPPELMVLFSSINAVTGGIGQVDYCAANAFLDATAERETAAGTVTVAIDWCEWQWDAWTSASLLDPELKSVLASRRETFGLHFAEGMEALRRILASGLRRVVVSTRDLRKVLAERHSLPTVLEGLPRPVSSGARATRSRPPLPTPFVAPQTEAQERLANLWSELLGIEAIGIHDDFFQLGGHSLLGLQLLSRIQTSFQVEVPLYTLFSAPTIEGLAAALAELRAANGTATLEKIAPVDPESLLGSLGELSDEQVDELLSQLAGQKDEPAW